MCFLWLSSYLLNIRVQLEYLSLPFHLSDTDLTGELRHRQAASLHAEGAMQGSLTATPDVVERDLLSANNNVLQKEQTFWNVSLKTLCPEQHQEESYY